MEQDRPLVWLDLAGLDAEAYARRALARLAAEGISATAGVARVPVAAEAAAKLAAELGDDGPVCVPSGEERAFMAPLPVSVLEPEARLLRLLHGVGIERCGGLAELEREPVEVRFGAAGVTLWRLARADDRRRLFGPVARERPHGSIDFIDYVVTDPARLLFTANALLGPICERLATTGEHARRLTLVLGLANGDEWRRRLGASRPTASRDRWLRLLRGALERITIPDAVAAVRLEVDAVEPAVVTQGDLFDRGFATAGAVDAAVARLAELRGARPLRPTPTRHPLAERAARWRWEAEAEAGAKAEGAAPVSAPSLSPSPTPPPSPALTLQLLPEPRPLRLETAERDGRSSPRRYHAGTRWTELLTVAGPDRLSGGQWEDAYAREYYRCVTDDGVLVWLFRDARADRWYLHGWWD